MNKFAQLEDPLKSTVLFSEVCAVLENHRK